jgi:hypothetical protein
MQGWFLIQTFYHGLKRTTREQPLEEPSSRYKYPPPWN